MWKNILILLLGIFIGISLLFFNLDTKLGIMIFKIRYPTQKLEIQNEGANRGGLLVYREENGTQQIQIERETVYENRKKLLQKICKQYKMTTGKIKNNTWTDILINPQQQVK